MNTFIILGILFLVLTQILHHEITIAAYNKIIKALGVKVEAEIKALDRFLVDLEKIIKDKV